VFGVGSPPLLVPGHAIGCLARDAFIDEMRIMAKLRHPCITVRAPSVAGGLLQAHPGLIRGCISFGIRLFSEPFCKAQHPC
jgi:hypothetical protein